MHGCCLTHAVPELTHAVPSLLLLIIIPGGQALPFPAPESIGFVATGFI
jgi:hypothetical protein